MIRPQLLLLGVAFPLFLHPFVYSATITVTNTADSGSGSLRQAILDSNASVGVRDTIVFEISADDPGHFYYRDDGIAGEVTPASVAATTAADDAAIADIDHDWPHSWFSIRPQSLLPEITDSLSIDGYTQPGAVENTNPVGQGLNSVLRIEIDGSSTQDLIFHQLRFGFLRFTGGGNIIRGLVVNRVDGPKIWLDGSFAPASGSRIEGNYIGPDVSGSTAHLPVDSTETSATHAGVRINSSSGNVIGGLSPSLRNLISANNGSEAFGIVLTGFGAAGNNLQGNLIGTDRSGTRTLSMAQTGVFIGGVPDNIVGGDSPGAANVISGNGLGIGIGGEGAVGNLIQRNHIGISADGLTQIGNAQAVTIGWRQNRILENTIAYNTSGVQIGDGTGNLISRNSIFENGDAGIDLASAIDTNDDTPVSDTPDQDTGPNNLQNYPVLNSATLSAGGIALEGLLQSTPNSDFLIEFFASPDPDPSNFGEGRTFIGEIEIVSDAVGNAPFSAEFPSLPAGQPFLTATATDITIRPPATTPANDSSEFSPAEPLGGCSFTVTNTGDMGLGTLRNALRCAEIAPGAQRIDFAIPPDDPGHLYYRDDGLAGQVTPASVATTTQADDANISDIDPDWPHSWFSIRPNSDLPEIGDTVFLDGYSQPGAIRNTIAAPGNLNAVLKIEVDGTNGTGHGLHMGLLPEVSPSEHRVEGVAVNRWPGNGIVLDTFGGCVIAGCFIGTDISGTVPLGNGDNGIYLSNESNSIVGGVDRQSRNLISANSSDGIEIAVFSSGNIVRGNLIGIARNGASLINGENGVNVDASSRNRIGGIGPGAANSIAFANGSGVLVQSSTKRVSKSLLTLKGETECQCNCSCEPEEKGDDDDDTFACDEDCRCLCNGDDCSQIGEAPCSTSCGCITDDKGGDCSGCECNCACECSEETANSTGNSMNQNQIRPSPTEQASNSQPKAVPTPAIDLGNDGVTQNDGDNPETAGIDPDADSGPNNLQNYPVLNSAIDQNASLVVEGQLESATSTVFRIEFFASSQCSSTEARFGETYLGFQEVVTDASGAASVSALLPGNLPDGSFLTSTATRLDSQGGLTDTSEFSDCILVLSEPRPCPTPFPDFNNDNVADALDLIEVFKSAANEDGVRDITGDGLTNGEDFLKFSLNWKAMDCSGGG